jgi:hypothetical protein
MLMLAGFHSSKKARYLQVTAQREQSSHQRRNHRLFASAPKQSTDE